MNRPTLASVPSDTVPLSETMPPSGAVQTSPPPYDEPVNITKLIRVKHGYGLNSFADYAEVKPQTVLRTDQGTYRSIPTAILETLMHLEPAYTARFINNEYRVFVDDHRNWTWLQKSLYYVDGLDEYETLIDSSTPPVEHPLVFWRVRAGFPTRMGFCTAYCLHPSTVRRFELGLTKHCPVQIIELFEDVMSVDTNPEIIVGRLNALVDKWLQIPYSEKVRHVVESKAG